MPGNVGAACHGMEDLEKFVEKSITEIAALPEERMRLVSLAERLKKLAPADAARFLDLLHNSANARAVARVLPVLVNPEGLKKELGQGACRAVCAAAIELGLAGVSRLFTDLPPRKQGLAGYTMEEEAKMEMMTLGQRRAMSKSLEKDTLDRLLSDPDPMVIGNILNNPRVTEKEVVKVASRRPNSPAILKLIAGHRVWSKRQGVKRALAMNPYAPPRTAIGLLASMPSAELEAISKDDTLHAQVRSHAAELVEQRKNLKD